MCLGVESFNLAPLTHMVPSRTWGYPGLHVEASVQCLQVDGLLVGKVGGWVVLTAKAEEISQLAVLRSTLAFSLRAMNSTVSIRVLSVLSSPRRSARMFSSSSPLTS